MWTKIGPNGRGLVPRLIDLVNVYLDARLVKYIDQLGAALSAIGKWEGMVNAPFTSFESLFASVGPNEWFHKLKRALDNSRQ